MSAIELYELPGCPYCGKVKAKLSDLDLEYVSNTVPVRRGERETVKDLTGQTGVPVLVDENTGLEGMSESGDIVEYLEETYG